MGKELVRNKVKLEVDFLPPISFTLISTFKVSGKDLVSIWIMRQLISESVTGEGNVGKKV